MYICIINSRLLSISSLNSLNSCITGFYFYPLNIYFQADEIEKILCHKFMRFMMMRAENFVILRRKPVEVCECDSIYILMKE